MKTIKIMSRIEEKHLKEINEFLKIKNEAKNISELIRISVKDFITRSNRPLSKEIENINNLSHELKRIGINLNQLVIILRIKEADKNLLLEIKSTLKQIKALTKEASLCLRRFNNEK